MKDGCLTQCCFVYNLVKMAVNNGGSRKRTISNVDDDEHEGGCLLKVFHVPLFVLLPSV